MARHSVAFASVSLLILMASWTASGSPTGAPLTACDSMTPGHGAIPQNGTSPYSVIPYRQDDMTVRITLSGEDAFRGYLVMAFDHANPTSVVPLGSFSSTADKGPALTPGNYLDCSSKSMSAATHKNGTDKYLVNLLWTPPAGFNGTVDFKTTFVQTKTVYWVKTAALEPVVIIQNPVSSGIRLQASALTAGFFLLVLSFVLTN